MFDSLLNAIGYVGDSLDKLGSRELRGALGGKPRELLSFVPFSDRLGITDPNDIQTGRDLLHKAGVMDRSKTGWGPTLAGMATEAALDPFTLLGGGKAAARAFTGAGERNLARLGGMLHVEKNPEVLSALKASRPGQHGLNNLNYVAAWGGGPEVLNEEINHGLTKMAALTGDASGLPMQSKIAASLLRRSGKTGLVRGLADTMVESAGHTARKEGIGGLVEGAKFWLDPRMHKGYHGQISQYSPLAASVYHAAPGAALGAAGGAGVGMREDAEDPVRGALMGALAGAVGGGIIGHAGYSPRTAGQIGKAGENAALGLKYDDIPPVRQTRVTGSGEEEIFRPRDYMDLKLARNDPEWINNRTFYHGTATPGLSPQTLDVMKTSPEGLYGRGIYTTDEGGRAGNEITKGYANSRVDESWSDALFRFGDREQIAGALKSGSMDIADIAQAMRFGGANENIIKSKVLGNDPSIAASYAETYVKNLIDQLIRVGFDPANPGPRFVADRIVRGLGGYPQSPSPLIYQAQSDFGKILDLNKTNNDLPIQAYDDLLGVMRQFGPASGADDLARRAMNDDFTTADLLKGTAEYSGWDPVTNVLRGHGYDAMTHTGGRNTGTEAHQVVIGLRPDKYRKFEPMPEDQLREIMGGESAAIDPRFKPYPGADADLNNAADYIGPGYSPNRTLFDALGIRGMNHGLIDTLLSLPPEEQQRIIQEIPPGSQPLGHGLEALALKTPGPDPWAIRVGPETSPITHKPQYRPNVPGVLQPIRSNAFGQPGSGVTVEHMPLANTFQNLKDVQSLSNELYSTRDPALRGLSDQLEVGFANQLEEILGLSRPLSRDIERAAPHLSANDVEHNYSNISWWEPKPGEPRFFTHDPGAAFSSPHAAYDASNVRPFTPPRPDAFMESQAARMNSPQAIRRILSEGARRGLEGQGLHYPGGERAVTGDQRLRDLYNRAFAELMMYNADAIGANPPWQGF